MGTTAPDGTERKPSHALTGCTTRDLWNGNVSAGPDEDDRIDGRIIVLDLERIVRIRSARHHELALTPTLASWIDVAAHEPSLLRGHRKASHRASDAA